MLFDLQCNNNAHTAVPEQTAVTSTCALATLYYTIQLISVAATELKHAATPGPMGVQKVTAYFVIRYFPSISLLCKGARVSLCKLIHYNFSCQQRVQKET
jgi:hypothetical protein